MSCVRVLCAIWLDPERRLVLTGCQLWAHDGHGSAGLAELGALAALSCLRRDTVGICQDG